MLQQAQPFEYSWSSFEAGLPLAGGTPPDPPELSLQNAEISIQDPELERKRERHTTAKTPVEVVRVGPAAKRGPSPNRMVKIQHMIPLLGGPSTDLTTPVAG